MSTHQVSKPWAANQSIAEELALPGISRSNTGVDASEDPWTKRIVPRAAPCAVDGFSQRNRRFSPFAAQCAFPAGFLILSAMAIERYAGNSCVRAGKWIFATGLRATRAESVFDNLGRALAQAGGALSSVVRVD